MTIKPFAIQGADLTLGGVNLQAGTTGVVIPGITRATSYIPEEINDTGDQTYQFAVDTDVYAIDAVTYNTIVADGNVSSFASYIGYTDGEGYIDRFEVNSQGTYTQQQATTAESGDIYVWIGTTGTPYDRPLVPQDWIQIPFRPKMRAGAVEPIGGGGGTTAWADITDINNDNGPDRIAIGQASGENQKYGSVAIGNYSGRSDVATVDYVSGDTNTTTLVVSQTYGIFKNMVITGTGFTSGQTVVSIFNTTTVIISDFPDSTPSGTLTFTGVQDQYSVAIGTEAGSVSQGRYAIAIGYQTGLESQGWGSVAIGHGSGAVNQGVESIGILGGNAEQGDGAIAIGARSGGGYHSTHMYASGNGIDTIVLTDYVSSIVPGMTITGTGFTSGQYVTSVNWPYTLGISAPPDTTPEGLLTFTGGQGANAIAIGQYAGFNLQAANSIILNATGGALENNLTSGLFIAPIRNDNTNTTTALYYNTDSKELTWGPKGGIADHIQSENGVYTLTLGIDGTVRFPSDLVFGGNGGTHAIIGNEGESSFNLKLTTQNGIANIFLPGWNDLFIDNAPGIDVVVNNKTWTFRKDGKLQLPVGADIVASDGTTSVLSGGGGGGGSLGNFTTYQSSLYTSDNTDAFLATFWDSGPGYSYLKLPGDSNSPTNPIVLANTKEGGAGVKISTSNPYNGNTEHNWTFGSDGTLTLPANSAGDSVIYSNTGNVELYTNKSDGTVKIRAKGTGGDNEWIFNNDGSITFPDFTVQTTAYTGQGGSGYVTTTSGITFVNNDAILSTPGTGTQYTSSLRTGIPSFLTVDESVTAPQHGFDSNGMWFEGNAELNGYPVRSNFTITETTPVIVEFDFIYDQLCADQGVCVFLDGDAPAWSWGSNPTCISAKYNCGSPELDGFTSSIGGNEGGGPLIVGNTYRARFTYNPNITDSVKLETFGTDLTTVIDTLVLQDKLSTGAYRVGLSGDSDGNMGGAPAGKAYFTDLSITTGTYIPVQEWKFGSTGDLTLPLEGNILNRDGDVLLSSKIATPVNINLDGGGASTIYEETSLLFADGGFASTRRTITDPLFDAGANGAGRVYGATDNLINGGGA